MIPSWIMTTDCPVPAMLAREESSYIQYHMNYIFTGDKGVAVELGPWLGGSTRMHLDGNHHILYTYDQFIWNAGYMFGHDELSTGDSFRHLFQENTSPVAGRLNVCETDLTKHQWKGDPIEWMFIDALKTPQIMYNIMCNWFPHLVKGAYIFDQDFWWFGLGQVHRYPLYWWLHKRGYIRPIWNVVNGMVFHVIAEMEKPFPFPKFEYDDVLASLEWWKAYRAN